MAMRPRSAALHSQQDPIMAEGVPILSNEDGRGGIHQDETGENSTFDITIKFNVTTVICNSRAVETSPRL